MNCLQRNTHAEIYDVKKNPTQPIHCLLFMHMFNVNYHYSGPALMFVRYSGSDGGRRFFACSAFRDRKDCSFFQWCDEKGSQEKLEMRKVINKSMQPKYSHRQYRERLGLKMKLKLHMYEPLIILNCTNISIHEICSKLCLWYHSDHFWVMGNHNKT